jgi:hypothetical protein
VNCKECGAEMVATVELTGGCSCGYEPGRYCGCDPPDVHVEFQCPACFSVFSRRHMPLEPSELSDQDSIAKWLTKHYRPGEKVER